MLDLAVSYLTTFAADVQAPDVSITPISSGTVLGGIAVIISLVISGIGLYRSLRLDQRAAKKQDIDTVIENYRLLLSEAKEREKKLEAIIDQNRATITKNEALIDEQRITISRLEGENAQLRAELKAYREAKK